MIQLNGNAAAAPPSPRYPEHESYEITDDMNIRKDRTEHEEHIKTVYSRST